MINDSEVVNRYAKFKGYIDARSVELLNDYNASKFKVSDLCHRIAVLEFNAIENGHQALSMIRHGDYSDEAKAAFNNQIVRERIVGIALDGQAYQGYVEPYFYDLEHGKDE